MRKIILKYFILLLPFLLFSISLFGQANAGADQSICPGGSATLTASGGIKYKWSTGDTVAKIVVSPNLSTTYTVTVTNSGQTSSDAVLVELLPSFNLDAGSDVSITAGTNTTLTAKINDKDNNGLGIINGFTYKNRLNDHYYYLSNYAATWQDAYTICKKYKAHLVTIGDATEEALIESFFPVSPVNYDRNQTDNYWIGLSDSVSEGTYKWYPSEPYIYKNWFSGYPNNTGNADYVTMAVYQRDWPTNVWNHTSAKGWQDKKSTDKYPFVMEIEPTIDYVWSNGALTDYTVVNPIVTTTYTVTINVSNYTCKTYTADVVVTVTNPALYAGPDQTIVSGKCADLLATGGDNNYKWSTGENVAKIKVCPTTTTTYILSDGSGNSDKIVISVLPSTGANAGPDMSICKGSSATLIAKNGCSSYKWSNGQTGQSASVSPSVNTTYTLTATCGGKTSTDNVAVYVTPVFYANAGIDVLINKDSTATLTGAINDGDKIGMGILSGFSYKGQLNNHYYYLSDTNATWLSAEAATEKHNGHLATVKDANEENFVENFFTISPVNTDRNQTDYYWIGLNDASSEGNYRWITNEYFSYSDWFTNNGGYPQNAGNSDYIALAVWQRDWPTNVWNHSSEKAWQDRKFNATCQYIMEIEPNIIYKWSSGESKQSIKVKPQVTTTYTLSVSVNGCIQTNNVIVTVNNPKLDAGPDQTIYKGGTAYLRVAGGKSPYKWNTGNTLPDIAVSPTVTTTYTVNDSLNNADDVVVFVINPTSAFAGSDQSICKGNSTKLKATGGGTYKWSTGAKTDTTTVAPTITTTYIVTVNNSGVTSTDDIIVSVIPKFNLNAGFDVMTEKNKSVTLTAQVNDLDNIGVGNIPGFTYKGDLTGHYYYLSDTVGKWADAKKVTEMNNGHLVSINSTQEETLIESFFPVSPVNTDRTQTDYYWIGLTDEASEGDYRWVTREPYITTSWFSGYPNNVGNADYVTMAIYQHDWPTNVWNHTSAKGWQDRKSTDAYKFIMEVEPHVDYQWSNGSTTQSCVVNPNTTTTYTITVTRDGCAITSDVVVTVDSAVVSAGPDQTIYKGNYAKLKATGGNGIYSWSNGAKSSIIYVNPSTTTVYTVLDGNNNGAKVKVTVILPTGAYAGPDQSICKGSSATLSATGGGSYKWNTGATTSTITVTPGSTTTYIVTVTNAGVTSTDDVVVVVSPDFNITLGSDFQINRGDTATLSADINGSLGNLDKFTYKNKQNFHFYYLSDTNATWIGAKSACEHHNGHLATISDATEESFIESFFPVSPVNSDRNQTDYYWIGLSDDASEGYYKWVTREPYNYKKWFTGFSNNSDIYDYVAMAIYQRDWPTNVWNHTSEKGWQYRNATATSKYLMEIEPDLWYKWSAGPGYATQSISITPDTSGTYSVTVTANGCSATSEVYVQVVGAKAYAGADKSICKGSSTVLTCMIDGKNPTYKWSTGEITQKIKVTPIANTTYKVTATVQGITSSDDVVVSISSPTANAGNDVSNYSGCNTTLTGSGGVSLLWSTGEVTASIVVSPTVTSTYKLTVTDKNGCTASDNVSVIVSPRNFAKTDGNKVICYGKGGAQLVASGGNTYEWSTGTTTATIIVNPSVTNTYIVTVSTTPGCTSSAQSVVTVYSASANAGNDTLIPAGAKAVLTATGGDFYKWSTGATSATITVTPALTTTYAVTTTKNGCTASDDIIVNVKGLIAEAGPDQSICNNTSATITASGGGTNGKYKWSAGDSTATIVVNPQQTTTYIVTVSNGGMTDSDYMVVTVSSLMMADAGPDKTIAAGNSATITAGGNWDSYKWSNGATTQTITVSPTVTTTYWLTATKGSCVGNDYMVLTVNQSITCNAGADQTICTGGTATLTATGGDTYKWSTGETTQTIGVLPTVTTTYYVTATKGGSTAKDNVVVFVSNSITVSAGADQTICSGNVDITAIGAASYTWSSGQNTAKISVHPTLRTTYVVTGTSGACTGTSQVAVTPVNSITATAGSDQTICKGSSVTLNGAGGQTYSWSNNATTANITVTPTTTTTYTLTASAWGCTSKASVAVNVVQTLNISAGSDQTINSGSIATLTATGGNIYSWSNGGNTAAINVNPIVTTTYTVTGTIAACTGKASVVVYVSSNAIANAGTDKTICAGSSTTLNAQTGTGYIYSWSSSQTTSSITVSPAITTTYSLTVKLGTSSATDNVVVYVDPKINASAGPDQSICQGSTTTLTATGGDSYSWSNNALTPIINVSPNTNTTYYVTATAGNCSASSKVSVYTLNQITANAGADQTINNGSSTALTATGGNTYRWSSGATSQSITVNPTVTSTYSVTAYDASGMCSATDNVVVTVKDVITPEAGPDQTVCPGENAVLTASGGDTYSWSTGMTNSTISVNPSITTKYFVTVKNSSNGLSGVDFVTVFVNSNISVSAGQDQTICIGSNTNLTVIGGSTFIWSNGGNTQTITVSPTATTVYLVTANSGTCSGTSSVTVTVKPQITANAGANQTIVNGNTTILNASGGTIYQWNIGGNSASITVSPTTTTTFIVTVSDGYCSATDDVIVKVVPKVTANAGSDQTICAGNSAMLTASGGYSYLWNTNDTTPIINVKPWSTTTYYVTAYKDGGSGTAQVVVNVINSITVDAGNNQTICYGSQANLSASSSNAGTNYNWSNGVSMANITVNPLETTSYIVTAEYFGCTATDDVVVNVKPQIMAYAGSNRTICNGSSCTITASGGISYKWNTGETLNPLTVSPATNSLYTVSVYNNGCSAISNVSITVIPGITVDAGNNVTICAGAGTNLIATGAAAYQWSTGDYNAVILVSPSTSTVYTVTGYTNSCSATDYVIVTVNEHPDVKVSPDMTICSGMPTVISASGGTSYKWNTGQNIASITVSPSANTSYTVTVTSGACSTSLMTKVTTGTVIYPDAGADQTICAGGNALLTAKGGTTYQWSMANGQWSTTGQSVNVHPSITTTYLLSATLGTCTGTDEVIVNVGTTINADAGSDQTICKGNSATLTATGGDVYSWNTGDNTSSVVVNPSSTTIYDVTVTSGICSRTDEVTVTVGNGLTVSAGADQTICTGGYARLLANGGDKYLWSTGSTAKLITVSPTVTTTYYLTASTNNCSGIAKVVVTVGNIIKADAGTDQSICKGGQTKLIASGGNFYKWSTGESSEQINVNPTTTTSYVVTAYSGTCSATDMVVVNVNTIIKATSLDKTICAGGATILTASGGESYSWSTGETTQNITVRPLNSTSYSVTVYNKECYDVANPSVIISNTINVSAGADQTICKGSGTTLIAEQGFNSYKWNTGETTRQINVNPATTTTYSLTVMSGGCTGSDQLTVNVVTALPVNAGPDQTICQGGIAVLKAGGGGTSFLWNTNDTTESIVVAPNSPKSYTVTARSAGCSGSAQVAVSINNSLSIAAIAGPDQTLCGKGNATLTATGGTLFEWSTGSNSQSITVSPDVSTNYAVTVSNNGCSGTDNVAVYIHQDVADAGEDIYICPNGTATLNGFGGQSYFWSTGETAQSITVSPSSTTKYALTVNDYGCTSTDDIIISVISKPAVSFSGLKNSYCETESDVFLTGYPAGGQFSGDSINSSIFSPAKAGPGIHTITYTFDSVYKNKVVLFSDDFSKDKGWTGYGNGGWERAAAMNGSICYGSGDPVSDVSPSSDNYIIGTNIGGCYQNNLPATYYLTSPVINCKGIYDVNLKYFSDLGYEGNFWDHVSMDVYDGSKWVTLFKEGISNYNDTGWVLNNYNVKLYADNNPDFRVRFGIGPTDASVSYKGWNIDDFEVYGTYSTTCSGSQVQNVRVYKSVKAEAGADHSICQGEKITLNGSGGNYYQWSPSIGLNSNNFAYPVASPQSTTVYTLTVTSGACSATDSVSVVVNFLPVVNAGNNVWICNGISTSLKATGAEFYKWTPSTGLSSDTIQDPVANPATSTTYNVVGIDANGCNASDDVIVFVNDLPQSTVSNDATICIGDSAVLTAGGGYSYFWTPAAGLNFVDLPHIKAGPSITTTYNVVISDQNGCSISKSVVITVNPLPQANAGPDKNICAGDTVRLSATGGSQYIWSKDISMSSTQQANTFAFPKVTTTYTVTVISNGCQATSGVVVKVFPLPLANAGLDQTICLGDSAMLKGRGGVYYNWSPSVGLNSLSTDNTVARPTITTTYTLLAIDSNGCKSNDDVIVNVNNLTGIAGKDVSICLGESTLLNATGGVSYRWSPSSGLNKTDSQTPLANPVITTTYTVTVTNLTGCTLSDDVVVTVNPLPVANAGKDSTICSGDSIKLNATGGMNYLWSPSNSLSNAGVANPIAKPILSTSYKVTVIDANRCKASDNIVINVLPSPKAKAGVYPPVCKGDSIRLSASGGQKYMWASNSDLSNINISNPVAKPSSTATYILTVEDINGCKSTDKTVITVNNLPVANAGKDTAICKGRGVIISAAGGIIFNWYPQTGLNFSYIQSPLANPVNTTTYTVTVKDINGCSSTDNIIVKVNELPKADAGNDATICRGDTIKLNASGGITYNWAAQNSLGNILINNPDAFPLTSAVYNVTVTDANGCSASDNVNVKVNPLPVISAGPDVYICNGDNTTLKATGNVDFTWSPATGLSSVKNPTTVAKPSVTTTYLLTGKDKNGCVSTDNVIVYVNSLPFAEAGPDITLCKGNSTTLNASGGIYYQWTGKSKLSNPAVYNPVIIPDSTVYFYLKVTDLNGCHSKDSVKITVNPLPLAEAGNNVTTCKGTPVTLNASGGTGYTWSPVAGLNLSTVSSPVAKPDFTTTYNVSVTDKNGCSATDKVLVYVNPVPVAKAGSDANICYGKNTILTGSGGISYKWTYQGSVQADTLPKITVHPSVTTTYTLLVKDKNNCTSTDDVIVYVNPLPLASAGPDVSICKGSSTTLTAGGGLTYTWLVDKNISNPYKQIETVSPVVNTTFYVTVADINGCKSSDTVKVFVYDLPVADAGKDVLICKGNSTTLKATGGAFYSWMPLTGLNNPVSYNPVATPQNSIRYFVTVRDNNGCTAMDSVLVRVQPLPVVDAGKDTAVCKGDTFILKTPEGYKKYSWTPVAGLKDPGKASTKAYANLNTTYKVIVTDTVGCFATDSVRITVKGIPTADAGNNFSICKGSSANLNVKGETKYKWSPANLLNYNNISNPVANPAVTTTFYVTVTNDINCNATDQVVVTVLPVVKPKIITYGDLAACDSSSLIAKLDAGKGFNLYQWSTKDTTQTIVITKPGKYWVRVMNANTCYSTSDTSVAKVYPKGIKPVVKTIGPTELCAGSTILLYTNISYKNYLWSSGSSTDTIRVYKAGKYKVTAYDNNDCPLVSEPLTVTLTLNPIAMFDFRQEDSLKVDFFNSSVSSDKYFWIFDSTAVDSVKSPVHYFNNEGLHTVILIAQNNCGMSADTMNIYVYNKVPFGIENNQADAGKLNIYPVPASDNLTIEYMRNENSPLILRMLDDYGQIVFDERQSDFKGKLNKTIAVGRYAKGVYLIQIITDKGIISGKVILE